MYNFERIPKYSLLEIVYIKDHKVEIFDVIRDQVTRCYLKTIARIGHLSRTIQARKEFLSLPEEHKYFIVSMLINVVDMQLENLPETTVFLLSDKKAFEQTVEKYPNLNKKGILSMFYDNVIIEFSMMNKERVDQFLKLTTEN